MDQTENFCRKNKLKLSTEKGELLQLKDSHDRNRPPTVKLVRKSIRMKKEVKYLGIQLQERL